MRSNADRREVLLDLFRAALAAVDPERLVPAGLSARPPGRVAVVGAGKAAAAMARAVENAWDGPLEGIALTRYGHAVDCRRIEIVEASHPVPDETGAAATARILDLAGSLDRDDLLLALISGGGSALLVAPARGVRLEEKRAVTKALLAAGAEIAEINAVRKHLSAIKGGRLAQAAHPASVRALAISDVPGDDPATIASGPTVADPTTLADARAAVERYGIPLPAPVARHLASEAAETPKPGDPRLARSRFVTLAGAGTALAAAARRAESLGLGARILGESIEGPAEAVAARMAERARRAREEGRPLVLLSGGECTVRIRGGGRGGPNSEFALAFALAAEGMPGVSAISADTDGIDGAGDHAGAVVLPDTLSRASAIGLDPHSALRRNDSAGFFDALGDCVRTGPTRTNVSDFRAIIVAPD